MRPRCSCPPASEVAVNAPTTKATDDPAVLAENLAAGATGLPSASRAALDRVAPQDAG